MRAAYFPTKEARLVRASLFNGVSPLFSLLFWLNWFGLNELKTGSVPPHFIPDHTQIF